MKPTVKSYRVQQSGETLQGACVDLPWSELEADPVSIRVHYSSINFKDALGATGQGKIYKKLPIIGGIDAAGVVAESRDARFQRGMEVLVTGCGLGESHNGGYCEFIRVPGDWVVPLPTGLSLREAMVLGTAGFTAALCIQRLEDNGQSPAKGPLLVTGASGGVGSLAVSMLAKVGYEVVAVTGKESSHAYLRELGAASILSPGQLSGKSKPLESVQWGGAIDNVGGTVLANILPRIQLWGNVAAVGLALSPTIETTLMPFILRGLSLLGISSTNCPYPLRARLWDRLAGELKPEHLAKICQREVGLAELDGVFKEFMQRHVMGRYLVNCRQ